MAPERVQRRLAAIWSADVVGYSRLIAADDASTVMELRTRREMLRSGVAQAGGRVVDAVGDNLLAEFPSAVAAVESAVAAQAALDARDALLPEPRRLRFRIGIDLGEVLVDGEALAGDAVNIAARLCALAEPGGVWLSAKVCDQVRSKLAHALEDRGEHALKNIAQPVRAYRVAGARAAATSEPEETTALGRPGVAVLPFENLSGEREQEHLADGIAEDLLTRMARWDLPVVARQSSFAYRGRATDVRAIGRELGVRYVVEGSIRRAGPRIRVTAQLIDAETDEHVWAENFDRELGDALEAQEDIARAIEWSMGTQLVYAEYRRAVHREPQARDPWSLVMRAEWLFNQSTPEGHREARRLLQEAVALAPQLSNAHASLALIEVTGATSGWANDRGEALAAALEAARAAIALNPRNRTAHRVLGMAAFQAGEHARARAAFERAVELDPENSTPLFWLGWLLNAIGRYEEAIPKLEQSIELARRLRRDDPPLAYLQLAHAHLGAGREGEAVRWAEESLQRRPDPVAHGLIAAVRARQGRLQEARRELAHTAPMRLANVERLLRGQVQGDLVDRILDGLRRAGMPE